MIGQTITHYKVLKKLGQGGMGIVYQAQDTLLDRLVALKFLPHHLTANESEKARFLQEAKAASALNHPNVCTIYGIEEHDGQQFIEMEYVEGATLREKFHAVSLKINDAINFAIQIGEALQEAHTKGIVHRDIKSDNIMVNTKNQIKVMDFGLAKLKGSLKLTRTSSTVGTLLYMAPEQIVGEEADARSDIFSFGVVVYEMITQHTPFRGEHEAAILYSVVNEPPEPIEKYRPEVSPELMRILTRALEKDPEDRYQSVADMVSELRRMKKDTSRVSHVTKKYPAVTVEANIREQSPLPQSQPRSKSKLWVVLSAIAVLVIGTSAVWYFKFMPGPTVDRTVPLNPNMTFQVLKVPFTEISFPGLSSDGNWVAFPAVDASGKWDIYYMNTSGGEPRRITSDSSADIRQADISPDGGKITYDRWNSTRRRYEVCVVSALGGQSSAITDPGFHPRWRPDGKRIGYMVSPETSPEKSGKLEFRSMQPDGSDNRLEFVENVITGAAPISFAWSPDGKSVALLKTFMEGYQEIFLRASETGKERQITLDEKNIGDLCWMTGDQIVYSSNKNGNANLWIVSAMGGAEGATGQITKGSGPDVSMKVSGNGKKLLYLQRQQIGHVWITDSNCLGAKQVTFDDYDVRGASFSPDGRQIAFQMFELDPLKPVSHIYVMDREGNNRRQLTTGNEIAGDVNWSPDGKWISYSARSFLQPEDSSKIYLIDPATSGSPKLIDKGLNASWVDPSTLIVFNGKNSLMTPLDGTGVKQFYEDSTFAIPLSGVSPKDSSSTKDEGNFVLFRDFRKGREGWWIVFAPPQAASDSMKSSLPSIPFVGPRLEPAIHTPNNVLRDSLWNKPKFLFSALDQVFLVPDKSFLLYRKDNGEVWKMSLPLGKEELLAGKVPGRQTSIAVRYDGKEVVYVESRISAKLVMVENLLKSPGGPPAN